MPRARVSVGGVSCMRYWEAAMDAMARGNRNAVASNMTKYNDCMFGVIIGGVGRALVAASLRGPKLAGATRPTRRRISTR